MKLLRQSRLRPAVPTAALLAIALSAPVVPSVDAATHRVPAQFVTIRAALEASAAGDTVLVAPGTYTGDGNKELGFGGLDIVLLSEAGPEATILDAGGAGRAFFLAGGETTAAVIDGFTIRNGNVNVSGGGIALIGSSPTVRNCDITGNLAPEGGGVSIVNGFPRFLNCTIRGNFSAGAGGGVLASGGSPEFMFCTITGNAAAAGGGVHASGGGGLNITGCTIAGNNGGGQGGGVLVAGQPAAIQGSIVWGNCASAGSGLYAGAGSSVDRTCSDIDATSGPGTLPISPSLRFADPLFCEPVDCALAPTSAGDYGLQASSPVFEDFECGTLGSFGVVCDDVATEPSTWSRIKAFRRRAP